MKSVWFRCAAGAGLLLASAVLFAQSPPASGQQSQPPAKPAAESVQKPVYRTSVDLVTTDVIVRDGRGQFVADLSKEQFEVFEDGVPQSVSSLVLVHGGRATNLALPPPAAPPEGIILPPARPTNDASGRVFILFIDDLHLDFKNTHRVRDLLKKIKNTLIHEGDMFGIVSTGTSSIAVDLTYDAKRIDEAIGKVMGGALKPTDIIQAPEGNEGPSEVRYRAHVAFSTAEDLMAQLDQVHNRRKALIYVSNGYDFNPFEKSRTGEADSVFENNQMKADEKQQRQQAAQAAGVDANDTTDPMATAANRFADADLARELSELTRSANRANATIYTFDPRGLVGMPDIDEKVDPTEWANYIQKSIDSLRVLAELTGGIAVVNQNDYEKALKRIDAETSDYYMLGYYSSNPDPLKRTRRVEVKVARKDLDVWSRQTYSLKKLPAPKLPPKTTK
ncbi:MAG: VWA domain-containing protein [Acidobacteria bacterium]|nr:VWA domain-containing protein [Acidobacteriota bacterium]